MNDQQTTTNGIDRSTGVRIAFETAPTLGKPIEVANGIFWIRLPLKASLDHVNVYALEDTEGWTLIDTGSNTPECIEALDAVFKNDGPLSHRPISRVISTHYHPDHIGLAGIIAINGVAFYSTRVSWLYAKTLQVDNRQTPCDEQVEFVERAGLKGMDLAAYRRHAPSNYSQQVAPLPYSYCRLSQDDKLSIGTREWTVHVGHGHASHHATLWSNDGIAITGDQILSGTASNLSVHPSEPNADLVSEWLESCKRFMHLAGEDTLCLPGHNFPFRGIPSRCEQLILSQEAILNRLVESLDRPKTAVECLETVYRRSLAPNERGALIAETVGFLTHLRMQGIVQRELIGGNAFVWKRAARKPLAITTDSTFHKEAMVAALRSEPQVDLNHKPVESPSHSIPYRSTPIERKYVEPLEYSDDDSGSNPFRFLVRAALVVLTAGAGFAYGEYSPDSKRLVKEKIESAIQYINKSDTRKS